MGFIIVDKHTGELISNKVYSTEGYGKEASRKARSHDKSAWVVIPMPSEAILKSIVDGNSYGTTENKNIV